MNYLHVSSYLSRYAFFVFAETNERCEVRHKFPTRAHALRHGDNQLCWTHPDQLRRRVEAHHCEPTSTRWPPGYSIPFSSFSLTQRVIMLGRVFTSCRLGQWFWCRGRRSVHPPAGTSGRWDVRPCRTLRPRFPTVAARPRA